jgi:hypothetical protein
LPQLPREGFYSFPSNGHQGGGGGTVKPIAAEVSAAFTYPKFLQYLAGVLSREIGACGLDTKAGEDAQIARAIIRTAIEELRDKKARRRPLAPRQKRRRGPVQPTGVPEQDA